MVYPAEPSLEWGDLSLAGTRRWTDVDAVASQWLGRPCLAVPSVRVGLCWVLEHAGMRRHRSHVLVPRFVGRCILNAIGRVGLPVEAPTGDTQAVIVVDQYGLRQDLSVLVPEFSRRGWVYAEDSPYGVGRDEAPGPGSLGRFIGLGKVLPIAQGALFVTDRQEVAAEIARRREEWSGWSLPVWLTMIRLRFRRTATMYSETADAAYEMYVAARGGHRWLRGNVRAVLEGSAQYEEESRRRLRMVGERLTGATLLPDLSRLGYVVPFLAGPDEAGVAGIFRSCGFDAGFYHVDRARNMLAPDFARCALIPLNSRIPRQSFERLVSALEQQAASSQG